jgi:hypothetical protein
VTDVELPMTEASAATAPTAAELSAALTPDAFEFEIETTVRRSRVRLQQN